jgi:phage anti-repressor protein
MVGDYLHINRQRKPYRGFSAGTHTAVFRYTSPCLKRHGIGVPDTRRSSRHHSLVSGFSFLRSMEPFLAGRAGAFARMRRSRVRYANPVRSATLIGVRLTGLNLVHTESIMTNSIALVPVFSGTINSQSVQLCDARTLHTFMIVLRDFSTWIKGRIRKFGFVEGVDFITAKNLSSPDLVSAKSRAQTLTDYHLTLNMAKELAMVENNAKGREARRYFIDCEKKALAAPSAPYSVSPDQTLSAEQAGTLRGMLDEACKTLAKDLQGMFMTQGWGKLKAHFKTDYRHIPTTQFTEAVSIVSRHIVKFSGTRVLPAPADDKPKFSLLQKRWLVYFDCNGVECAKPVPVDAFIANWDQVIDRINAGDVPDAVVLKLADAACMRLHIVSTHDVHQGWGDAVAAQIDSTLSHEELRKVVSSATKELWSRAQDDKKLAPQRATFVIQSALRNNSGTGQS